jgi:hypothetical protein
VLFAHSLVRAHMAITAIIGHQETFHAAHTTHTAHTHTHTHTHTHQVLIKLGLAAPAAPVSAGNAVAGGVARQVSKTSNIGGRLQGGRGGGVEGGRLEGGRG